MVSIITNRRKLDVPRTSAVDADRCATASGRFRIAATISGVINAIGVMIARRSSQTSSRWPSARGGAR